MDALAGGFGSSVAVLCEWDNIGTLSLGGVEAAAQITCEFNRPVGGGYGPAQALQAFSPTELKSEEYEPAEPQTTDWTALEAEFDELVEELGLCTTEKLKQSDGSESS